MKQSRSKIVALCAGTAIAVVGNLALAAEQPLTSEKNPPGDIPDNQVFVTYDAPLGYSVKVPEGWARADQPKGVQFSDKFNTIAIDVAAGPSAPTVASANANQVPEIERGGRAAKVTAVKDVQLPAGPAVLISYMSNSDPNSVTNKQIRLQHDRYLFFKSGQLATLDLAAPQGADNADDWALIAKSFHWK